MSTLNTRLKLRADTLTNWNASDLVLYQNELCVVYCGNDVTRFKIGDGINKFPQLKYTDETEIITSLLKCSNLITGSTSGNTATNSSVASGLFSSATGTYSESHGIQSSALHNYSFVWNGTSLSTLSDRYQSKGVGTFCLNPVGGIEGFYIGNKNLKDIICNDVLNVNLQFIKPRSENNLHIKLYISEQQNFSSLITSRNIDSRTDYSYFKALSTGSTTQWIDLTSTGLDVSYNNSPVVFNLPKLFTDIDYDYLSKSILYIKYSWYYIDTNNVEHISNEYSTIIPSTTEVGANVSDVVCIKDFNELKQNVIPENYTSEYDTEQNKFYCYSTKYNVLDTNLSNNDIIVLNDYNEHLNYRIKFTVGNENARILFYNEISGSESENTTLNSDSFTFEKNTQYYIEISHNKINTYKGSKVYVQHDYELHPLNTNIQIIRPSNEHSLFVKVYLSENQNFNNLITNVIDSKTNYSYFTGLINTSSSCEWVDCPSTGFSVEYSNNPINLNLPQLFKNINYDYRSKNILYAKYEWYWLDDNNSEHISDSYSVIIPSGTEVGANAHDVVNKKDFQSLKENVIVDNYTVPYDDDYQGSFKCYSTKYNILSQNIEDQDIIILANYNEHKTYKIKFTVNSSNNSSLQFYKELDDGSCVTEEVLSSESYSFESGKTYCITVCDQKIKISENSVYQMTTDNRIYVDSTGAHINFGNGYIFNINSDGTITASIN